MNAPKFPISLSLLKFRSPKRLLRHIAVAIGLTTACVALISCAVNEVTGRNQFILFGDSQMSTMGADAYKQIKTQKKISKDPQYTQPVIEVVTRIIQVSDLRGESWEVTVFVDDTPNAFALPGGKIGVHTGLFKVAKNKAQLAAVLGHEVGHVIAKHSAEQVSRGMVAELGVSVAGAAYGQAAGNLLAQMATLGVILPFSRSQESEADDIGLIYMARAGYDPREAVKLWQNFANYGDGERPPEFLSTHPAPETRIKRLEANMPNALAEYNKSPYR